METGKEPLSREDLSYCPHCHRSMGSLVRDYNTGLWRSECDVCGYVSPWTESSKEAWQWKGGVATEQIKEKENER